MTGEKIPQTILNDGTIETKLITNWRWIQSYLDKEMHLMSPFSLRRALKSTNFTCFSSLPQTFREHFFRLNHLIWFFNGRFSTDSMLVVKYQKIFSDCDSASARKKIEEKNIVVKSACNVDSLFSLGTEAKSLGSNMANVELLSYWLSCLSRTMYEKCSVWHEWARKNDSKIECYLKCEKKLAAMQCSMFMAFMCLGARYVQKSEKFHPTFHVATDNTVQFTCSIQNCCWCVRVCVSFLPNVEILDNCQSDAFFHWHWWWWLTN